MTNKIYPFTASPSAQMVGTRRKSLALGVVPIALLLSQTALAQQESADFLSCGCTGFTETTGKSSQPSPAVALLANATRISSGFGPRINPVFGNPEIHTGVDIAAPLGTPIHAAADGVILIAWLCGGYGNYVRISHGNGIATGYAHASRFARGIYSGARVTAGQVIAYVGSTGLSTGPHLHYEVLVKGWPVKPVCACARSLAR